jgi:hypothetical protein
MAILINPDERYAREIFGVQHMAEIVQHCGAPEDFPEVRDFAFYHLPEDARDSLVRFAIALRRMEDISAVPRH